MFPFEKLEVYRKALDFIDAVYGLTDGFPPRELYGLSDQFRRAAVSIALNVAEGNGRTRKDYMHFVVMARASAFECVPILEVAKRRKLITAEQYAKHYAQSERLAQMLSALIRALRVKRS